jgi:hypothetical protein
MKIDGSIWFKTAGALILVTTAAILAAAPASAQTMGEYGAAVGASSGIGSTGSTLKPPEAYVNPIGDNHSTAMTEVSKNRDERDDSYADHEERDRSESNGADEWSQVP